MDGNSIGIIGGADGPTAILITGNPVIAILECVLILAAIAAVITGIIWLLKRRKGK